MENAALQLWPARRRGSRRGESRRAERLRVRQICRGPPAERAPRADPHRRARFRGSSLARGALPLTELRTSPPARSPARTGGYSPRVLRSRQMISLNLAAASGSAHRGAALTAAVGSRRESLPGGASSGVLERLYGKGAPSGARLCDHHCPVIGCGMPYACKPGECSIKISSGPRHLQSRENRVVCLGSGFFCARNGAGKTPRPQDGENPECFSPIAIYPA